MDSAETQHHHQHEKRKEHTSKICKIISENSKAVYAGSSLLLKSDTILRHYFTKEVEGSTQKDDLYYIESEGIPAHELGEMFDTIVEVGDEEFVISYSPLSYAYRVLNSTDADEKLQNVMRAMYLYYDATQAYKAENQN